MIKLIRTDSDNRDFQLLVKDLDIELKERYAEGQLFYDQFNKIDMIKYVVLVYDQDKPVGCGAIKEYDEKTMEIKRMYVPLENRGKRIASMVLQELEKWSSELGFVKCILETGKKQPEAIRLYEKNNYHLIPNYGQYEHADSSVCFGKELKGGGKYFSRHVKVSPKP
ncbi:MAG: GNAT family N-acetyltransferase [Ginsengibacter sp.]